MRPVSDPNASALACRRVGSGPPVALLHGFTQTGACLGPMADDLAADHETMLVDLPGHGASSGLAGVDLWGAAEAVAAACGRATYIGYSMGGRIALHLALARPDLVSGLVLIGATAGIGNDVEWARRAASDAALADRVEAVGVDAFLDEWLDRPLFAGLPAWARFPGERRTNTVAGLAGSLRHCGTGTMEPLWERVGDIAAPVLCVAGRHDVHFCALAERLASSIGPNADVGIVSGAGHAAHLEAPEVTVALTRDLLTRVL